MAEPNSLADRTYIRLQQQLALSILRDDLIVASLAAAVAAIRDDGEPDIGMLQQAIRSHRVAVLKQGAVLRAAGIDV